MEKGEKELPLRHAVNKTDTLPSQKGTDRSTLLCEARVAHVSKYNIKLHMIYAGCMSKGCVSDDDGIGWSEKVILSKGTQGI